MGVRFLSGEFMLHSGGKSDFLIDCGALEDDEIATLARVIASRISFGDVYGIPTGGERLAEALRLYASSGPLLIVDDVATTGGSFEAAWEECGRRAAVGVCLFARGPVPGWVRPMFRLDLIGRGGSHRCSCT